MKICYCTDLDIGKRVIVYGGGKIGFSIASYLSECGIVIIAIIDKNRSKITNTKYPVIDINELDNCKYDSIVIGSIIPYSVREMEESLLIRGVKKYNIKHAKVLIHNKEGRMVDVPKSPQKLIDFIFACNTGNQFESEAIAELTMVFRYIIDDVKDKELFIRILKEKLYDSTVALENRVVSGVMLYEQKCLESNDNKELIACVYNLDDSKMPYIWFFSKEIAFYEQSQSAVVYNDEGIDRQRINKRIVDYYFTQKDGSRHDKHKGKNDRALIIVPELIGYSESASIYYRYIANAMSTVKETVKVIVASCSQDRVYGLFAVDDGKKRLANESLMDLNRELIAPQIEVEYIFEPIEKILNKVYDSVIEFDPEYVIDITDENLPVSFALNCRFPIFYYPMRTCTSGYRFDRTSMRYFGPNREVLGKQCVLPKARISLPPTHEYLRESRLGISEESFVVICVGGRFYSECDEVFMAEMINLMRRCETMYWVVVGVERQRIRGYFDESVEDVIKRIIFVRYETDLPALYKVCDVFLNPDRVGGGFSILFAMEQGLAIAALKKNGKFGAAWCGDENLIDGEYSELCLYIERLYRDSELLNDEKQKMRKKYDSYLDMKEWGKILEQELDEMVKHRI